MRPSVPRALFATHMVLRFDVDVGGFSGAPAPCKEGRRLWTDYDERCRTGVGVTHPLRIVARVEDIRVEQGVYASARGMQRDDGILVLEGAVIRAPGSTIVKDEYWFAVPRSELPVHVRADSYATDHCECGDL